MMNRALLMSDAHHFRADHPINPYYLDSDINQSVAQHEHDSIAECFRKAGITVTKVASPSDSQDGVYTANWALVRGNKAVLARLPNVRKTEEEYARALLEGLGKEVIAVPGSLRFSGQGDALPCGNYLFCGSGYRSDEAAQEFAADALGYTRIQLKTVPQVDHSGKAVLNPISGWEDSFFYDIDLALAVLREPKEEAPGLIAYCPEAFTPSSRKKIKSLKDFETIQVSLREATEAFALNLVSTGESVVMSAAALELAETLKKRGFTVYTPSITELSKGGGYIRCTSLTID